MFLNNKYARWYWLLMSSRREMTREGYIEKHHIIPESLGGSNDRSNIVSLTAREHFIAHLLLVKMIEQPHRRKMQYALLFLRGKGRGKGRQIYVPSSRIYEIVKREISEASRGRKLSEEHRASLAYSRLGKKNSPEQNRKIGEAHRGKMLSDETRAKISAARQGMKPNLTEEQRAAISTRVRNTKHPPRSDQWKQRQREAQQKKVMSAEARVKISARVSGANNGRAKTWVLERQDGTTFEVKGLKPWCKERGLSFDAVCRRDGRWFDGVRLLS